MPFLDRERLLDDTRRPAGPSPPKEEAWLPAHVASVLHLQRTVGNAAVGRALQGPTIQRFKDGSGRDVLPGVEIEQLSSQDLQDIGELLWEGRLVASAEERQRLAARASALQAATSGRAEAASPEEEGEEDELTSGFGAIEDELSRLVAGDEEEEQQPADVPEALAEPPKTEPEAAVELESPAKTVDGTLRAGNVQDSDLEGTLGVSKESLGRAQLERIGIPATDTPSQHVRNQWGNFGFRPNS